MSQKILSISIAAYNVEKYLKQLMNSIIRSQRMEDIEVIIVNDGSKDRTVSIAEEYVKMFPNSVVLIDKRNGGHGSTINTGISKASGHYFKSIDGDDWVDSSGLCRLVDYLKKV